jgi:hypothetical protein
VAEIRSASVGGAVAGGVLLPEPEGPWHFTWPDVVAKSVGDLTAAWARSRANPDAEPDDADEEYPGFQSPATAVPSAPAPKSATPTATGGNAWLLLAVVGGLFLVPKLLR